jgi:hypothetical protein
MSITQAKQDLLIEYSKLQFVITLCKLDIDGQAKTELANQFENLTRNLVNDVSNLLSSN